MPSYAQLEAEPYWRREIVTDQLDWLGDELCRRTGRPRDAFGSKGNNSHLNGGHRSQEWIKNSDWCNNTSYTIQTGLSADQLRHIAACDFTPGAWGAPANRALMMAQTKALWDAAKRGELTGLRQIFGTLNGRNAIGLNVLSGSTTVPDSSHLDHWHLTFDRKAMRDITLMRRIADIALNGDDMEFSDQLPRYSGHDVGDAFSDVLKTMHWLWSSADGTGLQVEGFVLPPGSRLGMLLEAAKRPAVHLSDADRAAIAAQVTDSLKSLIAALPKPPTAKEVADLLATRLAQ